MNIQNSRTKHRRTNTAGVIPTVPTSSDHTDGTWLETDIYESEFFVNTADNKVFTRCGSNIIEIAGNLENLWEFVAGSPTLFIQPISGYQIQESAIGISIVDVSGTIYTLTETDNILHVTGTAGCTITIPTVLITDGRKITVKDAVGGAAANNIIITTEGSETIDGNATAVIDTNFNSLTLYCYNGNLFII